MMRLSDKNPLVVAGVAVVVLALVVTASLNLKALKFWDHPRSYSAYLTNASGLAVGNQVEIRGVDVGQIKAISVHGNSVRVDFGVDRHIALGDKTSATVKVLNPLGTEFLSVVPAGTGRLEEPIPTSRTAVSMSLLGDLGQVSTQVGELNLNQLKKALDVTSTDLSSTSAAAVKRALTGLSEFSGTLAANSDDIESLVTQGSGIASVLNDRKADLVSLIGQGDVLLRVLKQRESDITSLLHGTTDLSREVTSILALNRTKLNPMLRNLQQIAKVLAKEDGNIAKALPLLAKVSGHLAAATGNGPFLDVVVPTGLLPDALIQQCTSAAYPAPKNPEVGCRP